MEIKTEIKNVLVKNVNDGILMLKSLVVNNDVLFNRVALFEQRHNSNKASFMNNTIDAQDFNIEQNRITLGLLELTDEIGDSMDATYALKEALATKEQVGNKLQAISLTGINAEISHPNVRKIFKFMFWVSITVLVIISWDDAIEGYYDGYYGREFGYHPYDWEDLLIVLLAGFFIFNFYKYIKSGKNWENVGIKHMDIEVVGLFDSVNDWVIEVLNGLNIKIVKFDKSSGNLIAEQGRGLNKRRILISVIIDKNKSNAFDLHFTCNHLYPFFSIFTLESNQSVLNRIKVKLIENDNYN